MSDRLAARRDALRSALRDEGAAAMIVSGLTNIRYLTGFSGSSASFVVTPDRSILVSDGRYELQIAAECPGVEAVIRPVTVKLDDQISETVGTLGVGDCLFESGHVTHATFAAWSESFDGVTMRPSSGLVEGLRMIKDDDEVAAIRRAVTLAETVFTARVASISATDTERGFSADLEHEIRRAGGVGFSFDAIVASGGNGALPHYRPAAVTLGDSPLLLVDWGAVGDDGYASDMTRVAFGAVVPDAMRRVCDLVDRACQAAIDVMRPGVALSDVDGAARKLIEDAGYGPEFSHGLGHGLG
ncbi:MAG: Xaa-Pro peptidase family protein, partial [Planctomycetota bacterium]